MNRLQKTYSLSTTLLIALLTLSTTTVKAEEAVEFSSTQSYSLKNDIEKTVRSYLLISKANSPERKNVFVTSKCEKPFMSEIAYGKCEHTVAVTPPEKTIKITGGEEVIIVASPWEGALFLGTVEYGCCGSASTVRIYDDAGNPIGSLEKMGISKLGTNSFTSEGELGNYTGKSDQTEKYFVIQDEQQSGNFQALKKGKAGEFIKLPVNYQNPNTEKCDLWFWDNIQRYYQKDYLTLVMKGDRCENVKEGLAKKIYHCNEKNDALECTESTDKDE